MLLVSSGADPGLQGHCCIEPEWGWGSLAKWRLSFMKGRQEGSNHSTVPMICHL
jgi:hypothetical protein